MNADGSGLTNLTNNSASDYQPVWSPDGTKIAFFSIRDGGEKLYVMDSDGSSLTRLTNQGYALKSPVWSTDGSRIVYTWESTATAHDDIHVVDVNGSGSTSLTNLTNHLDDDLQPFWSKDDSQIYFSTYRDGNSEIYVMNADGSELTNLTNDPGNDFSLSVR